MSRLRFALLWWMAVVVSGCGSSSRGTGGSSSDCTGQECGLAPQGVFTVHCSNGSVAGAFCSRYANGKCAWSLPSCPDSTSCTGEACGPAFPGDLCEGLGNYGVCVTDGKSGCNWRVTCFDLPASDAAAE